MAQVSASLNKPERHAMLCIGSWHGKPQGRRAAAVVGLSGFTAASCAASSQARSWQGCKSAGLLPPLRWQLWWQTLCASCESCCVVPQHDPQQVQCMEEGAWADCTIMVTRT